MGSTLATEISEMNVSLEQKLAWHLQGNHYPPVPLTMIQPCIEAIMAYFEDDIDAEIEMPEGVTYKGFTTAPAWAIVEQHHLDWFIDAGVAS
jgi:hypothetical protein